MTDWEGKFFDDVRFARQYLDAAVREVERKGRRGYRSATLAMKDVIDSSQMAIRSLGQASKIASEGFIFGVLNRRGTMAYSYDRRIARGLSLDSATRRKANAALVRRGFDGNGRFRTTGQALTAAFEVLNDFGIEPAEVFSAWHYKQPNGTNGIQIAFSNPEDSFSPVDVTNSVLHFSWTTMDNGLIEIIAYLS